MRIVSLEPGATEILCAIGLGDEIVGVADDPSATDLAELAATPFVARATRSPSGARLLRVDADALAATAPELVLVPPGEPLPDGAAGSATVLTLGPTSLEGVLNSIATIGAMTSTEDAALELIEELRNELGGIEERVRERADEGHLPGRVVALEWLDPLHASGRWVPEQVRRAGGWEVLGAEGVDATPLGWPSVADVDPETILVMPRGLGLAEILRRWAATERPEGWEGLEAVRRGQVFAVDARGYFSLPGPRLIDGVALVAELLDPEGLAGFAPEGSWAPLD